MSFRNVALAAVIGGVLAMTAMSVEPAHAGEFARQHPRRVLAPQPRSVSAGPVSNGSFFA